MPKTQQIAALPWRRGASGIEILLVTTRSTKRWVIPKGWTMEGKADHEAAAIEAYEEAGVSGTADAYPLGEYSYVKTMQSGKPRLLYVQVFPIAVDQVLEDWPERLERERQWVAPQQALAVIGEPELLPVIASFAKREGVAVTQMKAEVTFLAVLKKWWHLLWAGR